MKELKLEVGKTYRNRIGEVRIVNKDNTDRYPYQGSDGEWYTENGRFDRCHEDPLHDLIEEVKEVPETHHAFITPDEAKKVTATRYTFAIPDGVKELTVEQVGNRIIVEMVPEAKGPKPGDIMINDDGSVYIFKEAVNNGHHIHYVRLGGSGELSFEWICKSGRPATPEEAQPLFDALKKARKQWDAETMEVEEIPERELILEWGENNLNYGHHTKEGIVEAIEAYLKYREDEK